jgi:hypothetical protein
MMSWTLLGTFLALLAARRIDSSNAVAWACFFCIAFLYVNTLRERVVYGDLDEYLLAAENLREGKPLHRAYIYPPLWATILQPLMPLGRKSVHDFCWSLNIVSLCAFYFLLRRALERYGFPALLATVLVFLFLVVNVPVLRTLGYGQVNLHVMNLILISLLVYPRRRLLSAFALGLAAHLKVSPLALAPCFLLERDWRWGVWFIGSIAAIAGATLAVNGMAPYQDWLANTANIYGAAGLAFRENSVDSFVRGLSTVLAIDDSRMVRYLIGLGKACLISVGLVVTWRCVRERTFGETQGAGGKSDNAMPGALVCMVLAAPLMWEHHPVFLSLSYLVLLRKLESVGSWLLYGFAYFLEFLAPTFDFFPWSYGRLLSPLIWLALAWSVTKSSGSSRLFQKITDWLAQIGHIWPKAQPS